MTSSRYCQSGKNSSRRLSRSLDSRGIIRRRNTTLSSECVNPSSKLLTFWGLEKILKYKVERRSWLNESFGRHKEPNDRSWLVQMFDPFLSHPMIPLKVLQSLSPIRPDGARARLRSPRRTSSGHFVIPQPIFPRRWQWWSGNESTALMTYKRIYNSSDIIPNLSLRPEKRQALNSRSGRDFTRTFCLSWGQSARSEASRTTVCWTTAWISTFWNS
jgi:hypothetical protein